MRFISWRINVSRQPNEIILATVRGDRSRGFIAVIKLKSTHVEISFVEILGRITTLSLTKFALWFEGQEAPPEITSLYLEKYQMNEKGLCWSVTFVTVFKWISINRSVMHTSCLRFLLTHGLVLHDLNIRCS